MEYSYKTIEMVVLSAMLPFAAWLHVQEAYLRALGGLAAPKQRDVHDCYAPMKDYPNVLVLTRRVG